MSAARAPQAREFADLARRFCWLCEDAPDPDPERRVREVLALLAALVSAAARLPDVEPSDRPDVARVARRPRILGFRSDAYRECFDPYSDEAPVHGSLLDDLGDVYADLRVGLDTLERGTEDDARDALWAWRFGFESHWGEHATGAIRALYWLLRPER